MAANAVNDVLDIDTDTVGKPHRPLPTGRLTARSALLVSGTAALAAVAFACSLGSYAILWAIVLLALAFLYSYRAKNTVLLGNAIVALCASSPILFVQLSPDDLFPGLDRNRPILHFHAGL